MATRDELVRAVSERYSGASREDRGRILDEFAAVTGLHRKHAVRLLRGGAPDRRCGPRPGRRVYDVAVREALIVVWEASDRVCGKRLRPLVPLLIDAMERHGHLQLAPEVRGRLLAMSAATIDRALREVRGQAGKGRRRASPSAGVRRRASGFVMGPSGGDGGTKGEGCWVLFVLDQESKRAPHDLARRGVPALGDLVINVLGQRTGQGDVAEVLGCHAGIVTNPHKVSLPFHP